MKITLRICLVAMIGLSCSAGAAEEDGGLWATADVSTALSERLTGAAMLQFRFNDDIGRRERTLLRPSLSYRIDPSQVLTLGYDAHFINLVDNEIEQRTWQEYLLSKALSRFTASMRLRLEQRFFDHVDGVPVRLRIKPALQVPVVNSPWFFSLSNEFFVSFNQVRGGQLHGFHENRAFAGFGRTIAEGVVGQLGYQNQYIERIGRDVTIHQIFVGISVKLL